MKMIALTNTQISTLIDILKEDCETSGWGDIDFTDADHMQFLAMRAGILQLLKEKELTK